METIDELVGKKAYKNSGGHSGLVGTVEKSDTGITPLWLLFSDGLRIGAFPKNLVIVDG